MSANAIKVKLRIAELKREIVQLEHELLSGEPETGARDLRGSYRDFRGVLRGKLDVSDEALEQSRYKLDWESQLPDRDDG